MADRKCTYCGETGQLTGEHVMPAWLIRELPDYSFAAPGRERHMFGGHPVIRDVCTDCNNGPLSKLDEHIKSWWNEQLTRDAAVSADGLSDAARWAAKVTYNAQRFAFKEGLAGDEPSMPDLVRKWILGRIGHRDQMAVCATTLPLDHRDAELVAHFASRKTKLPLRYVHIRRDVFFVAWDPPSHQNVARDLAMRLCGEIPAVRIDNAPLGGTVELPEMRDPDMIHRGFWNDSKLIKKMTDRFGE